MFHLCYAEDVPVVPQGGNTGIVGAGVLGAPGGVIISIGQINVFGHLGDGNIHYNFSLPTGQKYF